MDNSQLDRSKKSRLQWHCRRGMLELDLLLQPFVEKVYDGLNDQEKDQFNTLLGFSDQELLECLMLQKKPEDKNLNHVITKIRDTV